LVEGLPGMGKTRLLEAAGAAAVRRGLTVINGSVDELAPPAPLAPLLDAMSKAAPIEVRGQPQSTSIDVHMHLQWFAAYLEMQAAHAPTLITLDDLQWADPATPVAARALIARLDAQPVGWLLSRRLRPASAAATDWLFSELEQAGAARVELAPLAPSAAADVVSDLLGATPEQDLLALADRAAGNPRLLVELIAGLREEGGITATRGRARLLAKRTPRRIRVIIQERLDRLSQPARDLLDVAASLGEFFAIDDLAQLAGRRPTSCCLWCSRRSRRISSQRETVIP
jgi:predicted ATPase